MLFRLFCCWLGFEIESVTGRVSLLGQTSTMPTVYDGRHFALPRKGNGVFAPQDTADERKGTGQQQPSLRRYIAANASAVLHATYSQRVLGTSWCCSFSADNHRQRGLDQLWNAGARLTCEPVVLFTS